MPTSMTLSLKLRFIPCLMPIQESFSTLNTRKKDGHNRVMRLKLMLHMILIRVKREASILLMML